MSDESLPILLVEDDPIVLDSTAELLSDGGFDVRRASSAEEAMKALSDGPLPAVLVTDISLANDRSRIELPRTVTERSPQAKLLSVSRDHRPTSGR